MHIYPILRIKKINFEINVREINNICDLKSIIEFGM